MFPIATTTVTCTASDPLGNNAHATFTVTVADKVGPIFSPVDDISVEATVPGGAMVPFAPTATDQVSGARPVTCMPRVGEPVRCRHHDGKVYGQRHAEQPVSGDVRR